MRDFGKAITLLLATALLLSGCGSQTPPVEAEPSATQTEAPRTATASATPEPTGTATPSREPTATLSPTPAPQVRVSTAVNCRAGPAETFPLRTVVEPGQVVRLVARAAGTEYLYVVRPDRADEFCWLWAGVATIEGEHEPVPDFTPEPSPTPLVGFDLYLRGFEQCGGDTRLVLIVNNSGASRLMTAEWGVFDLGANDWVRSPRFERHPFADSPGACNPGHGNILDPGGGAFLILPLGSPPSGNMGYATIKLCSQDYLGGDCATKEIYVSFP